MPLRQFHSRRSQANSACPEIIRLWLLRLLVPLGAHREFIRTYSFSDDLLAVALGLGRWIDGEPDDGSSSRLDWIEDDEGGTTPHNYDPKAVLSDLRRLHRLSERKSRDGNLPDCLRMNIARLSTLVGLSANDAKILAFTVMVHNERLLDNTAEWLGQLSSTKIYHVVSVLLDLPEHEVRKCLAAHGVLARSGLVTVDHCGTSNLRGKLNLLSTQFADRILSSEADPVSLLRDTVAPSAAPSLTLDDFTHITRSLAILQPYLRQSLATGRRGVNVFLHGEPGTGKSQLAKVLAAHLGCDLFEVASEDENGDPVSGEKRLRAFRAAQSFFAQRRAMIVFDEAEDVFNDGDSFFGRKSTAQTRKAWINRMLEDNPVPALWLSNTISCLDPAFIRRFDMVIELPVPTLRQRQQIVQNVCGDLLNGPAVARVAESDDLAPAIVARAASVVRLIRDELSDQAATDAIEHLIGNTLEAQGHRPIRRYDPSRLPETYDPAFIHADADLAEIAEGLARRREGRLCLYGPSGTGKTAYGRWLAERLGMPLHARRASDLLSMYVGGTEQCIAQAFRQAERDGALLLIDEVDSFLQDRRGAHRSWEVTAVNEMLTQMEGYAGLFIASTNLMDGLDQAALRRFDLKVKFDFLKPEQSWELLHRHCAAVAIQIPAPELRSPLDRLTKLTPGDFATVIRQHGFRPIKSAAALITALDAECALKEGGRTAIGFV